MLRHLEIRNYALIDQLELDFYPGLNTITGETGAGKSILLGALGLIMGERADASMIAQGAQQCVVEAEFAVEHYGLQKYFESNDWEYSDTVLVRRQMGANGKSRAFVNDVPATLVQLRGLTEQIVDIHSQHANLLLQDAPFQMQVLDAFAANGELLAKYGTTYHAWRAVGARLTAARTELAELSKERDYLTFQLEELKALKLREGEQEALEARRTELEHADEIAQALGRGFELLGGDDEGNVLERLRQVLSALNHAGTYANEMQALAERVESVRIELQDVTRELESALERVEANPRELEAVSERLDALYHLENKHQCSGVGELLALAERIEGALGRMEQGGEEIAGLEREEKVLLAQIEKLAGELHARREAASGSLGKQVEETLRELGIVHAAFTVHIGATEEFTPTGRDRVEFLFSANRQVDEQPLSRVASGGEMSRVMLSLKRIMALSASLPTIIFDEIDTGVSGNVAAKMGAILGELSRSIQVINITHLPQIAAQGEHHFLVYKDHEGEQTVSRIRLLTAQERVREIAGMLSGAQVTEASLQNARDLLKQAQNQ